MAWTSSMIVKTVVGDQRCHILKLTADAATQNVETGLDVIHGHMISPCSMAAVAQVYPNVLAAGTSSAGYLGCSGFTSGDELFAIVFGR